MSDTPLPGFELPGAGASAIEKAAAAQIEDLQRRNLIGPSHAIPVALVQALAGVVGQSAGRGRGSAVAMAAKELREALALLPTDPGPEDPMEKLNAELAEAEARALAAHGGAQ